LESIGPAEDTLIDRFINSNQDLMYRLTIKSSPTAGTDAEAEQLASETGKTLDWHDDLEPL
jgi:hypothetical protein